MQGTINRYSVLKNKRILVIDDDQSVRNMICQILSREGYETVQAGNGFEALGELQANNRFSLVITDLIMPEKEGIETIRDIRKKFPDIIILAISGGGICLAEGYLNIARAMGANASLCKPFGKKELLNTLETLIP
jgi:CheY-like chemotaxis protein